MDGALHISFKTGAEVGPIFEKKKGNEYMNDGIERERERETDKEEEREK